MIYIFLAQSGLSFLMFFTGSTKEKPENK